VWCIGFLDFFFSEDDFLWSHIVLVAYWTTNSAPLVKNIPEELVLIFIIVRPASSAKKGSTSSSSPPPPRLYFLLIRSSLFSSSLQKSNELDLHFQH
jgi:hypothetical protein